MPWEPGTEGGRACEDPGELTAKLCWVLYRGRCLVCVSIGIALRQILTEVADLCGNVVDVDWRKDGRSDSRPRVGAIASGS